MKEVIADDHPMVREALCLAVQRGDAQALIVEAQDFDSALAACTAHAPDIALLDLNMPGMNGADGVRRLRERFPDLPMIVASAQDDPPTIRSVLYSGANGYFPKTGAAHLLQQAIALVCAGGMYLPAGVLDDYHNGQPPARVDASGLTPRQLSVLQRLMHGHSNKLIARELGLTEGTVKIHIAAILRTLQVRNRTEAVVRAHELGLGQASA